MTMLVVDASVAVKLLVAEPGTASAKALLRDAEPLIAPDWIQPEVANALWKKVARNEITQQVALDGIMSLPEFFERTFVTVDLLPSAYDLMFRLRHPPYDCFYLALAIQQDVPLITADLRFHRACVAGGEERLVRLLDCAA